MKKLGFWMLILLLAVSVLPLGCMAAENGITVPVLILVEGPEPAGFRYTVVLESQSTDCPMPKKSTLVLGSGEEGAFRIPCDRLGVFDYTIRQLTGEKSGCFYDESCYRLRLYVTAGEDGSPEGSALLYGQEGTKETAVLLRNRWPEPVPVRISARKTLDGNTPEDGAFRFLLLAENGEVVYEAKNRGRQVNFPAMEFEEGTYRFFLKEAAGEDRKILYDRTVYTLTVTVSEGEARLEWERNGKPWTGTPSFANYTDTGSPKTGDAIRRWIWILGISGGLLILVPALGLGRRKKP